MTKQKHYVEDLLHRSTFSIKQNCDLLAVKMDNNNYAVYKNRQGIEFGSIISEEEYKEAVVKAEQPIVFHNSYIETDSTGLPIYRKPQKEIKGLRGLKGLVVRINNEDISILDVTEVDIKELTLPELNSLYKTYQYILHPDSTFDFSDTGTYSQLSHVKNRILHHMSVRYKEQEDSNPVYTMPLYNTVKRNQ
jgi:hypothetical protein